MNEERLNNLNGIEYIKEWFIPEDLEVYVRERSLRKTDWDDPIDWINGITTGLAFSLRGSLININMEAKFRIQVAMFLTELIWRIDFHEK